MSGADTFTGDLPLELLMVRSSKEFILDLAFCMSEMEGFAPVSVHSRSVMSVPSAGIAIRMKRQQEHCIQSHH